MTLGAPGATRFSLSFEIARRAAWPVYPRCLNFGPSHPLILQPSLPYPTTEHRTVIFAFTLEFLFFFTALAYRWRTIKSSLFLYSVFFFFCFSYFTFSSSSSFSFFFSYASLPPPTHPPYPPPPVPPSDTSLKRTSLFFIRDPPILFYRFTFIRDIVKSFYSEIKWTIFRILEKPHFRTNESFD